jgi:hypothetical protein
LSVRRFEEEDLLKSSPALGPKAFTGYHSNHRGAMKSNSRIREYIKSSASSLLHYFESLKMLMFCSQLTILFIHNSPPLLAFAMWWWFHRLANLKVTPTVRHNEEGLNELAVKYRSCRCFTLMKDSDTFAKPNSLVTYNYIGARSLE